MTNGVASIEHWNGLGRNDPNTHLLERISELENRLDNEGWIRLDELNSTSNELSLSAIKGIARKARRFFLVNPIIERGVSVSSDYTFGRGISISARDEEINAVIQTFIDDRQNQVELTSHQAMLAKDREQQCDGNTFLVFVVHPNTGRVRVRSIPLEEITDVICNPQDRKEPWYYRREWQERTFNTDKATYEDTQQTRYYRDWRYKNTDKTKLGEHDIVENMYVMHIKTGAFSDWKYGVSEVYSSLDWAKAYKSFLSNWATLMEAYARFALIVKTSGGARGVAAIKDKLATTAVGYNTETNPPPLTGSTAVMDRERMALDVVKTAGATTKAEEGRRLVLMAWAGMGLPETFGGDVSVGTLATAESLDRPTELKFSNRQEFWQDVLKQIIWFVIEQSVYAPQGLLNALANQFENEYGEQELDFGDTVDTRLTVKFPEIISLSIKDQISSIISMVTLDGKTIVNFQPRQVVEMLLNALGADDIDETLELLFPNGDDLPQTESGDLISAITKLAEAMNNHAG